MTHCIIIIINVSLNGFRKQNSTELASLQLVDYLSFEMDSGKTPLNIYLDHSKAFDTLNHSILLDKLKLYGLTGVSLNLFESYLHNRTQIVQYDSAISDCKNIVNGVPQGSIWDHFYF